MSPPTDQPGSSTADHGLAQGSIGAPSDSEFGWFGLRTRAVDSRLFALVGLLLTMGVLGAAYFVANELAVARDVTVFDPARIFMVGGHSLDSRIPYLPWTILIYHVLYEALLVLPVLTYPKTEAGVRELFALFRGLGVLTLVACVAFVVCPAEMTLRADAALHESDSLLHRANLAMHTLDRPFNTWPSLHVAWTTLVLLTVGRWLGRARWSVLLALCWLALSLSTLTVRQHYLWDVMTGASISLAYWRWTVRPPVIER